ncbi:deoxyribodipyrimidine photolyase-related protein [Emticicia oligotrophica DSM 17448]|uniref:Deoxyribodipyrimidine photolyase-related protein n=1 Tax=Emticicia oligotrophica (strain DSM 17448 / CIP 109782 / MTCC 6937 / GPTSA100-15) TaxID=929562 RepID=A0ABM5MYI7_EMTOG|nr:cryptochrome/photolyase family protein [Emticicia oligotrophica]AFK02221.1 deoxyribodipyrimidine photolyase-related protein [Emticicia oligotrophica DSM 17448]
MVLRLILGDQLNYNHSWFREKDDNILYVMMEIKQETDYVKHHIQKVVGFFAAMRIFAQVLQNQGNKIIYINLDDEQNTQSLTQNLQWIIRENEITQFEYQLPDEYRLDEQLKFFSNTLNIPTKVYDSEHFLSKRNELAEFFKGKKTFLMENFYRMMRKKYDILMEGNEPITGQWNYDAENRKKLPKEHRPVEPLVFNHDVSDILEVIQKQNIETIGSINPKAFVWPINREESLQLLDFFVKECLPLFGTYEDAMATQYWSIYHSRLSFSLNTKLLSPLEVVKRAVAHWQNNQTQISIAQIEGFVRQIIGWREYMRGIYWAKMPDFQHLNFFEHRQKLPGFFWNSQTKMNCMKHSIGQSLNLAYAHHIQRLMIIGNFCLLSGINPDEVDEWYLGVYIDAIEWVEITNTRGMSQYADGGIVGSKPYVGSANYIDKMSDYCSSCFYDKSKKVGHKACPFNSLYWHFFERNREKLERNPRIGMAYVTLNKMPDQQRKEILNQAEIYLNKIEEL